ncbi:sugar diacid recognition domain-containing protein [Fusibacter sp. 3D3]|uniref:CdaR family transcriptional regulator n=1 Tax=Fusibacter sp. 3D3 TaxID=1048380 RepID=UPI000853D08A|nr:sugar diacid recognition domain-containing protein [Fusibacter sp. 3D3]GAU75928.1 sugar diacid utilization regulator SdaR [Fusibacter sp. 3D3]
MLTEELAHNIVKKIISILGKNINIINSKGIIIASGDIKRIGSFHEGAARAISKKETIEINMTNKLTDAVKPGVNIPIYFEGKIEGVVGITGDPNEIRGYGELVRHMVEMMMEEVVLRQQAHFEELTREALIQDLVSGNWIKDSQTVFLRGERVGYNLRLPRIAIVFDIKDFSKTARNYLEDSKEKVSGEILLQQLKNNALLAIKAIFVDSPEEIIGFIGTNRIALLKVINTKLGLSELENRINVDIQKCKTKVCETTNLELFVGIGRYHDELIGLKHSYEEAISALTIGRRTFPSNEVFFMDHLQYEYLVNHIPKELARSFYRDVLKELIELNERESNSSLIQTLDALFKNNLNSSSASRELYIHRNTMLFRLDRIREITGLNPTDFYDAASLHLSICLYGLYKE